MVSITPALDATSLAAIRILFLEYAASLDVDLAYEDFQREVASLPGDYASPRGCLFLATEGGDAARAAGFRAMRLDSLPSMRTAHTLYDVLGFQRIAPYRFSPVADNLFMELVLTPTNSRQ